MMRWILSICSLFSVAFCQDNSPDVVVRGVILVDHPNHLIKGDLENYGGVTIENVCLPGNSLQLEKTLNEIFIGHHLCKETILAAEEAIVEFYHKYSHPLVLVFTPDQVVSSGVVQIVVLESCIGQICF